jgi:hypothetical protein
MTSPSGSPDTSFNSRPASFSFSNLFQGSSGGDYASKFRSLAPSVPISPPPVSPSSFFAVTPGPNQADFLDSPIMLTSAVSPYCNLVLLYIQIYDVSINNMNCFHPLRHFHLLQLELCQLRHSIGEKNSKLKMSRDLTRIFHFRPNQRIKLSNHPCSRLLLLYIHR